VPCCVHAEVGEAVNSQPQEVNEGTFGGDTLKYHELLKTAEKPLHPVLSIVN
jgi:hypothetical protein